MVKFRATIADDKKIPQKIKPFVHLGFQIAGHSGDEVYGDCLICGKKNKLYINRETTTWQCKSSLCAEKGNLYSFLDRWIAMRIDVAGAYLDKYEDLAQDRGISVAMLRSSEILWDYEGKRWALPCRNVNGTVVNIYFYKKGSKLMGLPALEHAIYGGEYLRPKHDKRVQTYVCEGPWDAIALRQMLLDFGKPGITVGIPGEGVFKPYWPELFTGRNLVFLYDRDVAGKRGMQRAAQLCYDFTHSIKLIDWPDTFDYKYDVRDYLRDGGTIEDLLSYTVPYNPPKDEVEEKPETVTSDLPPLAARPSFDAILKVYSQNLNMTTDMRNALRIIFATVYSNNCVKGGDPLWVFIVGPPGSGKTELLLSCSDCAVCLFCSSMTAHTLVSGYELKGKRDPSLLPKLVGKTFILKDFTEILRANRANKDEIYSTLRGAYDGSIERGYGNGVQRNYKHCYFSMLAGVTQSIYGEQTAALGERFLNYHMNPGVGKDNSKVIGAAMDTVGAEFQMKAELMEAAKSFIEVDIPPEEIPKINRKHKSQIIALSQVVAILRATVEKSYISGTEKILYKPQHEIGTRIAKQLKRLTLGLALTNSPPKIKKKDFELVQRVATDSCIGWNYDALRALSEKDGLTANQIADISKVPKITLRDQLNDLVMLGAVVRHDNVDEPDAPSRQIRYWISHTLRTQWEAAGLPIAPLARDEKQVILSLEPPRILTARRKRK